MRKPLSQGAARLQAILEMGDYRIEMKRPWRKEPPPRPFEVSVYLQGTAQHSHHDAPTLEEAIESAYMSVVEARPVPVQDLIARRRDR